MKITFSKAAARTNPVDSRAPPPRQLLTSLHSLSPLLPSHKLGLPRSFTLSSAPLNPHPRFPQASNPNPGTDGMERSSKALSNCLPQMKRSYSHYANMKPFMKQLLRDQCLGIYLAS